MQTNNQPTRIGTLGPSGTSSEQAAFYFTQDLSPNNGHDHITLYDTFDEVLASLMANAIDMAIVPHAYQGINEFYINPGVKFYQMFQHDTPRYGLYKYPGTQLSHKKCVISSHPAPVVLLDYLLSKQNEIQHHRVKLAISTVVAAKMVAEQKVEAAITNEKAAKIYDLELLAMYGPIQMGWSVFIRRAQ